MKVQRSHFKAKNSFLREALYFIVFIIISQAAGIIGSIFTSNAIKTWYVEISRPSFTPPNWIFAAVLNFSFAVLNVF